MIAANGVAVPVESSTTASEDYESHGPKSQDGVNSLSYHEAGDRASSLAIGNRDVEAVEDLEDTTTDGSQFKQQVSEHQRQHAHHESLPSPEYMQHASAGGGGGGGGFFRTTMVPPPMDLGGSYEHPLPQQFPIVFNHVSVHSSAARPFAYPVVVTAAHNSPPMMLHFVNGQPMPRYANPEPMHGGSHMPRPPALLVQGRSGSLGKVHFDPGPPIQLTPDGHGPEGCNLFVFHLPNVCNAIIFSSRMIAPCLTTSTLFC